MFEELFRTKKFQPQKVFRQGPRVYVVGGCWGEAREDAVFKTAFRGGVSLTSQHLRSEAIFLKSVPFYLASLVPALYDFGCEKNGRFWYLVEWVKPGKRQVLGESDFVMMNNFFTQSNLSWCLQVLAALRRLSGEVSPQFAREISRTSYKLSDYRVLMGPQGRKFFDRKTLAKAKNFLDAAEPIYNRANRAAVTHHEFYGSQILTCGRPFDSTQGGPAHSASSGHSERKSKSEQRRTGRTVKLVDWENIGWGNPLRDFTSMWVRAYEHPAWQKKFLDNFRKEVLLEGATAFGGVPPEAGFEVLFGVEKILQSFGNLTYFSQTPLPVEISRKKKAVGFFRRCVLETLDSSSL